MIEFIITGGTIDKKYNELKGELFFDTTCIPAILKNSRTTLDTKINELLQVDSLDMTAEERTLVVANCKKSEATKIVITHGTDTMAVTAKEIAALALEKTIVITGAMIPNSLENTDAPFNIAAALAFVQTLENGVYIAMNGTYFKWDNVQKNTAKGIFEPLS